MSFFPAASCPPRHFNKINQLRSLVSSENTQPPGPVCDSEGLLGARSRCTGRLVLFVILQSLMETALITPGEMGHKLLPGRALFLKIKWPGSEFIAIVGIYAPTNSGFYTARGRGGERGRQS